MKQLCQLALLWLGLLVGSNAAAQTIYVKSNAAGANNGSSWANAYVSLDVALAAASPTSQVWVAAGTYKPSTPAPNHSFGVTSGVLLYGGFAGTETALSQRNIAANVTTLSGDISGDDTPGNFALNRADNSLHVVLVYNGNPADRAVIDGFKIQSGNTSNVTTDADLAQRGGGIIALAKLTVRNCTFTDNFGRSGGGLAAIAPDGSGLIVDNCLFTGNSTSAQSAGVYMRQVTAGEVNRCIFNNNVANRGCLYPEASSNVVIDSCLFENNNAGANTSAGLFTFQTTYTMTNTVIRNNTAATAPAMYNDGRTGTHPFTIDNCLFENNTATVNIGAIQNWQASFLMKNSIVRGNKGKAFSVMYNDGRDDADFFTVDNCLFENNIIDDANPNASTFGGAMSMWQASFLLNRCTFKGNEADNGGAIYADGREFDSEFSIDSCLFEGNKCKVYGGGGLYCVKSRFDLTNSTFRSNTSANVAAALWTGDTTVFMAKNCLFETNSATFGGGVATFSSGNAGTIDGCTFFDNEAVTSGGAIINGFTAKLTVKNSTFSQNTASFGGGIFNQNDYTALTVEGSTFSENGAVNTGGAINLSSGNDASIKNCLFTANSATTGGAVDISEDSLNLAVLTVDNTIFRDNICITQAGALNQNNADVTLTNCLFAGNVNISSTGFGGAISSNAAGGKIANVNAINCTFAANAGALGAGIALYETDSASAVLTLQNCVLENAGVNYAIEAGTPQVTSLGGNLSSDATLTTYLTGTNDVNGLSPLFVDVASYDFHVPTNSPAIDIGIAAGAPLTDIAGNPRINEPDAGCYENQMVIGTSEAPKALPLQLVPNPATEFVQLTVENDWLGAVTVEVLNPAGVVVRILNVEKSAPTWQFRLDVKDLPQGAYFAKARMGGTLYLGGLIKQ